MYHDDTTDLTHYVAWGVLFSLLVHVLLVLLFVNQQPKHFDTPVYVDVEFEPPAKSSFSKQQIVETPDVKAPSTPPIDPRYLSEKDVAVQKEQIQRGDPLAGAAVGKQTSEKPEPPAPVEKPSPPEKPAPHEKPVHVEKQEPKEPAPQKLSLRDLSLDTKTMQEDFVAADKKKQNDDPLNLDKMQPLSEYHPFSRPYGSGARVLGNRGSNEYLPSLPDGDITMLNTKADKFAVFVRRVATQVFTEMRSEGWDLLRGGDIRAATQFATVHAILSPKGDLLSVSLDTASGSQRFDQLLVASTKKGARDPNPPPGARANDGNIHFIFQSRSWVEPALDGRTGANLERRWVLLGTGLE